MKSLQCILGLVIISFLLIGCQNQKSEGDELLPTNGENTVNEEPVLESNQDSYPQSQDLNYPDTESNIDQSYPGPSRIVDESKRFSIDRPLSPGMSVITGTGPAGASIRLVSISNVGESLGFGIIDEDGVFEISILRELETQEAIAIMLGDESEETLYVDAPGSTDIPLIGFVLDMATTAQPEE